MKKREAPPGRQTKTSDAVLKETLIPQTDDLRSADQSFPIVGIGASAGGLEALEIFLENVPAKCGMAFVIVQHLDPTRKGVMVELLQRSTPMPVVQIKDRMRVKADCVYMIPPNRDLSILHGVLHLLEPTAPRGLRLPIDFFLRSLADDRQNKSIGVILSGMGSDGTLGLRAIKENAGVAFVQSPATAKFDGMPRSAIGAGLADVIAPAEELPGRIFAYLQHAPLIAGDDLPLEGKSQSALEKIFILLRTQTGHDFSLYKKNTVYRRIERRMGLHQINRIASYVRLLQENPQETELLFKELMIGVTRFFRDPDAWETLKEKVIPALLAANPAVRVLRAWTPGCSTGEEAYSLAMIFKEAVEQLKPPGNFSLQIFATDLDKDAIEKARAGFYPANIAADVSAARLRRFFVEDELGWRVGKEIREMVIFASQNVIMDPPFTKLDLLICRNLLIYLDTALQKKLLPLFHYSLNPAGFMFLGSAETIGAFTDLFAPLDGRLRIYRRRAGSLGTEPIEFPSTFFPAPPGALKRDGERKPVFNLQAQADQLILQEYAPAAVLTNDKGDILYISGRTGKYLEPAAGKVNWNLFVMAREGLRYELPGAFTKASGEKGAVTLRNVKVKTNGGFHAVDVEIRSIVEPAALAGMVLTVFRDAAAPPAVRARDRGRKPSVTGIRAAEMEQALAQARHELQTTREEMQTSQEEFKSMHEELQSTNEELQSTNEELTTSKEEMQSMNEELQTVNSELQAKVDDSARLNNDMKNLLDSTEIATLFLDEALNVRRFTSRTSQIIKLIPGDAGRPVTDIASNLRYPELADDAREVLRSLVFIEKQVSAKEGRWFQVRIMPYRTLDNRIDGLVITFTDITRSKALEAELRKTQAALEMRVREQKAELEK
jgi:two-component system CheB/CheR fusion protein